jgi:hypothetical protein
MVRNTRGISNFCQNTLGWGGVMLFSEKIKFV